MNQIFDLIEAPTSTQQGFGSERQLVVGKEASLRASPPLPFAQAPQPANQAPQPNTEPTSIFSSKPMSSRIRPCGRIQLSTTQRSSSLFSLPARTIAKSIVYVGIVIS